MQFHCLRIGIFSISIVQRCEASRLGDLPTAVANHGFCLLILDENIRHTCFVIDLSSTSYSRQKHSGSFLTNVPTRINFQKSFTYLTSRKSRLYSFFSTLFTLNGIDEYMSILISIYILTQLLFLVIINSSAIINYNKLKSAIYAFLQH